MQIKQLLEQFLLKYIIHSNILVIQKNLREFEFIRCFCDWASQNQVAKSCDFRYFFLQKNWWTASFQTDTNL